MRYAVIENDLVTNIVLLADISDWHTPTDILIKSDTANIGDSFNGTDIIPAPPPPITWAQYQQQAQALLDKVTGSSGTVIRCYIAGIPLPAEWQTYISELRAIIKATSGDPSAALPTQPAYPAGS